MSDTGKPFTSMVPGFDFLQGLVKNAGAAMPGMNRWVAPTLDPDELDKNISELKTVQFWLEQNARMLATTIQALEVQRMTLSTLKSMNVSFGDLTEALKIRLPEQAQAEAPAPVRAPAPPAPAPAAAPVAPADEVARPAQPTAAAAPAGVIDPMQWWGALTQQFGQIAAKALQDGAGPAPTAAAATAAQPPARKAARKPARKAARKAAPRGGAAR